MFFSEILIKQDELDSKINNVRSRELNDIITSMVAELIELNEETKYSHKTWKSKEQDTSLILTELVDIYFFYAQLVNFKLKTLVNKDIIIENLNVIFDKFESNNNNINFVNIINIITSKNNSLVLILEILISLTLQLEFTKKDIIDEYVSKWNYNMTRISNEWN